MKTYQSVSILPLENFLKPGSDSVPDHILHQIGLNLLQAHKNGCKYARIEFSVEEPDFNVVIYPDTEWERDPKFNNYFDPKP